MRPRVSTSLPGWKSDRVDSERSGAGGSPLSLYVRSARVMAAAPPSIISSDEAELPAVEAIVPSCGSAGSTPGGGSREAPELEARDRTMLPLRLPGGESGSGYAPSPPGAAAACGGAGGGTGGESMAEGWCETQET